MIKKAFGILVKRKNIVGFRIRYSDKCKDCDINYVIQGIREKDDKYYEVIVYCPVCHKVYTFVRMKRKRIDNVFETVKEE